MRYRFIFISLGCMLIFFSPGLAPAKEVPSPNPPSVSAAKNPTKTAPSTVVPPPILVDDFETGSTQGLLAERKNRLDAFQGTFAKRPSYTVITKVPDERPGHPGDSLRIEYAKLGGWCGWYTLLNGIDVSKHNALTFWVKGEKGGERFDIGFADDKMQDFEIDAVYAGPITAFLPEGVTTEWQQVKVPLASLRSDLNLSRMGSLVFWFRYEGKGAIQIDDVAFVYDTDIERMLADNSPRATADSRFQRFSWVWKYDPVNNKEVREELLTFSKGTALKTLFIYLGEEPIDKTPPDYQQHLAEFLREAHAQGVEVEALQGNPLWALRVNHPQVVRWVKSYLDFNQKPPVEERIDGVSLDIEPYLTSEWEGGDREKLKAQFVELLTGLRQLIDANKAARPEQTVPPSTGSGRTVVSKDRRVEGFHFGIAIPVFYKREAEFEEQLLAQVDYAALMDYYDAAVDIIENGRFHVDLASRLGKKVIVGVETQDLVQMGQGKNRNTFHKDGWQEMERHLKEVADTFAKEPGFGGLAIHCYESYRLLQKRRNVPTRERSDKVPPLTATRLSQPVTIDGDLSDWSKANWFTVDKKAQVVYGVGAWTGAQDMSFRAAFQWEPDALLMAIDVTDNIVVQEKKGADMWEGDHVEVWLDTDLYSDYNEAVNSSDDLQIGLSPGNFADVKPEVYVWVPSIDPKSIAQVHIAAKRTKEGYTLEVRFPTKFLFQTLAKRVGIDPTRPVKLPKYLSPEQATLQATVLASGKLQAGFRLGLMIDGSDTDEMRQPQKCMLSTSPERQWGDPTTFNVLELK